MAAATATAAYSVAEEEFEAHWLGVSEGILVVVATMLPGPLPVLLVI